MKLSLIYFLFLGFSNFLSIPLYSQELFEDPLEDPMIADYPYDKDLYAGVKIIKIIPYRALMRKNVHLISNYMKIYNNQSYLFTYDGQALFRHAPIEAWIDEAIRISQEDTLRKDQAPLPPATPVLVGDLKEPYIQIVSGMFAKNLFCPSSPLDPLDAQSSPSPFVSPNIPEQDIPFSTFSIEKPLQTQTNLPSIIAPSSSLFPEDLKDLKLQINDPDTPWYILSEDACHSTENYRVTPHTFFLSDKGFTKQIQTKSPNDPFLRFTAGNEHLHSVNSFENSKNFALLKQEDFPNFASYIQTARKNNLDLIIMDPIYKKTPLDRKTFHILQKKYLGLPRILFARINIGYMHKNSILWKSQWEETLPPWLIASDVQNLYYIKYWSTEWRQILEKYIENIMKMGYHGIVLEGLDVYLEFEKTDPTYRELLIQMQSPKI